MKSQTLHILYDAMLNERDPKNRFQLEECNGRFFKIVEIYAEHMGNDKAETVAEMLSELCEFIRETAFEVGFYSAYDISGYSTTVITPFVQPTASSSA